MILMLLVWGPRLENATGLVQLPQFSFVSIRGNLLNCSQGALRTRVWEAGVVAGLFSVPLGGECLGRPSRAAQPPSQAGLPKALGEQTRAGVFVRLLVAGFSDSQELSLVSGKSGGSGLF